MLDCLPSEILLKTFKKTEGKTRRNCRLLSARLNNFIVKFNLQRGHTERVKVIDEGYKSFAVTVCDGSRKRSNTYSKMLEGLAPLTNNICTIGDLDLCNIELTEGLLSLLLHIRKISKLTIDHCRVVNVKVWFHFLTGLELDCLRISRPGIPLPPTILNNVTTTFDHTLFAREGSVVIAWLTDDVLEQWFAPHRRISLNRCKTQLTIGGIINVLEKMETLSIPQEYRLCNFGILARETMQSIENAVNGARGVFTVSNGGALSPFRIKSYLITLRPNSYTALVDCLV